MQAVPVNATRAGVGLSPRVRKLRPRILYLAPTWPHANCFGQQLRVLHVGRALQQLGDVKLAVGSDVNEAEAIEKTAGEFQILCKIGTQRISRTAPWQRLRWWLDPHFQDSSGFLAGDQGKARIYESLGDFDLIWLNSLRLANMFGIWRWPRAMLDVDDVPSTYQLTEWRNSDRVFEKLKAGARALALQRRERLLKTRFSVLGVCSEADRQYLGGGSQIHVIPNGFERPLVEAVPKPVKPPRIGFIGVFTHPPNFEGIRWFMKECWPLIKRVVPDARLRLVGKESDGPLKPADPDVDGLGFVGDPTGEIATWSAMIVPLRLGSGTRLKVGEAFSRKCPLVSTRFGALGYDVADGREAILSDTADSFAAACIRLMREPSEGAAMAGRAWRRFLNDWTWDAIAPRVWEAAEDCLRLSANG
jgi:glycosyltransferase involved in cell wall biosynthesis